MESAGELEVFARQRERLLERMDKQRVDLDDWLTEHIGPATSLTPRDLANLAALVQLRRDTLMELVKLDDEMLERLLKRRHTASD